MFKKEKNHINIFRIFKIDDIAEVWVGKNSSANDKLTFEYSSQNDLWFHVRGASGSHALLRIPGNSGVTKEQIKTAAEICAFYSKAKNSKNVKVAYTKISNVKKYKGAEKGSVVIRQEKIITVSPGLPENK
jgi:predicted ribosome quality control (RQC) complex YloA/Tae2 family protein